MCLIPRMTCSMVLWVNTGLRIEILLVRNFYNFVSVNVMILAFKINQFIMDASCNKALSYD